MAEKRKLAFYIRLSDADEEVKEGTKDESNSITGQRKATGRAQYYQKIINSRLPLIFV